MRLHPLHRLFQPIALSVLLAAGVGTAAAQTFSLNWNPRSGDVWVDNWLGDMNRYGTRYQDPFIDEMVRYHGAPRDLVTDLLLNRRWAPGDVYYACALAQVIGRPCGYVADYWQAHHGQGWGEVAQHLGIKPGSAAFHRLKNGFVPTYDRWARPITLDDDLRRAFPGRGKSGAAHGVSGKDKPVTHAVHGNSGKAKPAAGQGKQAKGPPAGKGNAGKGQGKGKH